MMQQNHPEMQMQQDQTNQIMYNCFVQSYLETVYFEDKF